MLIESQTLTNKSKCNTVGPTACGSKKCKHTPATGTPLAPNQNGHNFWSMVDKWFAAHMWSDKLGTL